MKTVLAMFPGNRTQYSYYVPEGDDPKVGDWILTSVNFTLYDERSGLYGVSSGEELVSNAKFARIIDVETKVNSRAKKFYIQLFSTEALKRRREENLKMYDAWRAKRKALETLNEMLKKEVDLERFERLAAKNEKARELLDLLKGASEIPDLSQTDGDD